MPSASHTAVYEIPVESMYAVLADYASYPEFLDHFEEVTVRSRRKQRMRLEITGRMMGRVRYTLDVELDPPNRIAWEFIEGDGFHSMEGYCELTELKGGLTEVTYAVDVHPRVLAPSFLVQRAMRDHLPPLLDTFYQRALELSA